MWVTADALAAFARRPLRLATAAPRSRASASGAAGPAAAAGAAAAKAQAAKRRKRAKAKAAAAAERREAPAATAPEEAPPVALAPTAKREEAADAGGLGGDERAALVLIALAGLGGTGWLATRPRHPGGPPAPA